MIVEFVGDRPSFALGEGAADANLVGDRCIALDCQRNIGRKLLLSYGLVARNMCNDVAGFRLEVVPGSLPRKEARKRSKRFLSLSVGRRCAPQQQGQVGADVSVATGPKGRDAEASTDASLRAEIVSYSRSRGLFAGVSLEGTSLRPDDDASAQVYGRKMTAGNIVTGKRISIPASGRHLVDVLEKNAPHNESKVTANR